jgi:cobalt-zinc-cadmium efflux system membrane fusion protein
MQDLIRNHRTLVSIAALVLVAALAFGLGRFYGGQSAPPPSKPADPSAQPASSVAVTDDAVSLMGIGVEPAVSGDLSAEISVPASVTAAVNGQAVVTAHAAGSVSRVDKRLGESVKAGETLALVTSRDGATLAAARRATESRAKLARSVAGRERELFDQRVTPRQDLEAAETAAEAAEAEAASARLAAEAAHVSSDGGSLAVVSPIAGRITSANAALGRYVEPDTELFRVADPRYVVVEAAIPANDALRVHAGDRAEITTQSGATLSATVASVTPTINTQTGSATATLSFNEDQTSPVPGEFVRARIMTKHATGKDVVVADEAVQSIDGRDVVFVRSEKGFRIQPVTVASRGGGRVAIRSGLKAGERVAVKNAFLLKAEATKSTEEEE